MMNSGKKPRMVISGDGGMNDDEVREDSAEEEQEDSSA